MSAIDKEQIPGFIGCENRQLQRPNRIRFAYASFVPTERLSGAISPVDAGDFPDDGIQKQPSLVVLFLQMDERHFPGDLSHRG